METKKLQRLCLGAHMSIKNGFWQAVKDGASIECQSIQFFSKSNRQWYAKKITQDEVTDFQNGLKGTKITLQSIMVHASYLINIASSNQEVFAKSKKALLIEIERCAQLGVPFLVLHPGSRLDFSIKQAIEQASNCLDEVIYESNAPVTILIENMAGQGSSIGSTFEELGMLFNLLSQTSKQKLGFCIDTCHLFAAGTDYHTTDAYENLWKTVMQHIPLDHIKAFHINDSKTKCGSHVDRHEHIGHGLIPLRSFQLLLQDKRFWHIPKILETPYASLDDHKKNISILVQLASKT
ncbi:deoxyribonuclease IV [bacterium]|nr:MAG: deoxyribonuclease IV [bacterium]QQR62291.1 MAG: deoxyribonuclease IV [bacterium]